MLKKAKKAYYNICRIDPECTEIQLKVDDVSKRLNEILDKIDDMSKALSIIEGCSNDLVHANFFHDTIKHSEWFDKPLSLSGWAIGYNFAYILYRVLEDFQPKRILELGLGQSTKIINEYAKHFDGVVHHIVEHDSGWVDFFKRSAEMSEESTFHLLECYTRKYKGVELNAYKEFKKEFEGQKFDFIVIDAPVGSGREYSRMDVLDLVPDGLGEQFVILLDDCNRIGEQNTIKLLEKKLEDSGIEFSSGYDYRGRTNAYICTSKDLDFLCHI